MNAVLRLGWMLLFTLTLLAAVWSASAGDRLPTVALLVALVLELVIRNEVTHQERGER